jgi:hypothetical protein
MLFAALLPTSLVLSRGTAPAVSRAAVSMRAEGGDMAQGVAAVAAAAILTMAPTNAALAAGGYQSASDYMAKTPVKAQAPKSQKELAAAAEKAEKAAAAQAKAAEAAQAKAKKAAEAAAEKAAKEAASKQAAAAKAAAAAEAKAAKAAAAPKPAPKAAPAPAPAPAAPPAAPKAEKKAAAPLALPELPSLPKAAPKAAAPAAAPAPKAAPKAKAAPSVTGGKTDVTVAISSGLSLPKSVGVDAPVLGPTRVDIALKKATAAEVASSDVVIGLPRDLIGAANAAKSGKAGVVLDAPGLGSGRLDLGIAIPKAGEADVTVKSPLIPNLPIGDAKSGGVDKSRFCAECGNGQPLSDWFVVTNTKNELSFYTNVRTGVSQFNPPPGF